MSYSLPDYTGADPRFKKQNVAFLVYKNGAVFEFVDSPIFADTLVVKLADGSDTTLVKDTDWTYEGDDLSSHYIGQAKLANPDFDRDLIKSIKFIGTRYLNQKVIMSFQEWKMTSPGLVSGDGSPVELNPDTLGYILSTLAGLSNQVSASGSTLSDTTAAPTLLLEDIQKERSANLITNEVHDISTASGKRIIIPVNGEFFRDSTVVRYNNVALIRDVDFTVGGFSALTAHTSNTSGIYRFLVINKEIEGSVNVDYHAVGGSVSQKDVRNLYEKIEAMRVFLAGNNFVTASSIPSTTAYQHLAARQAELENQMRALLSGSPTYQDATGGTVAKRTVTAPDAGFHWYNLARLYKVSGSDDIVLTDQYRVRVRFTELKVTVSIVVDVDWNSTRKPVSFRTESLIVDPLYTGLTDVSAAAAVYPMFRVITNQVGSTFSGAFLQVGVPIGMLTSHMEVEDLSSVESCWITDTATTGTPSDNAIALPDGSSVWSTANVNSKSYPYTPVLDGGYLLYHGAGVNLSDIKTTNSTASQFPSKIPNYFNIDSVKEVVLTLTTDDGSLIYDVSIPLNGSDNSTRTGRITMATSSMGDVPISARLMRSELGAVTISLNVGDSVVNLASLLTDLENQLNARNITVSLSLQSIANVLTDNIRIIRLKV
jgi:hypothetical protein